MSIYTRSKSIWHTLPLISTFTLKWHDWWISEQQPHYRLAPPSLNTSEFEPYAVDMWPLLAVPFGILDEEGVPYNDAPIGEYPSAYNPTTIAQYALAHWNAYLTTADERHKEAFMSQVYWLMAHEACGDDDKACWPILFPSHTYNATGSWLSALTQGNCISVLVRAHQLTHEDIFLQVARRAIRTFYLDIVDGGVSASVGNGGIFFEEVAVYPAAHILNGYLLALFGLYDYATLTHDASVTKLIQRSLATLHTFIEDFDTGYWSYYDICFKRLSPRFYHALHITLLEALARYSGCEHCVALAARWTRYQQSFVCRKRYVASSLAAHSYHAVRTALLKAYAQLKDKKKT